jgi:hypothetical protein
MHPKVVQERLGHSQISVMLETYSHVPPTLRLEAASKLDAVMRAGQSKPRPSPPFPPLTRIATMVSPALVVLHALPG